MNSRQARILEEVLRAPGNDNCADCHAPAPRWASVNLGIFLCVQCASVHRKMGTHTSRVKSVTLDTWTREQVDAMRQTGNVKANAEWNPNERLHPPPTNTGDVERDSDLERYIRLKYEAGRFKAVREAKREVKPNPELRDIIASRPKTSPLPDLPPEARAGRATAPPRQRPTPRAVDLVQTALASTSTLPLQMAPQVQVQMQLQSPYQMQMQMMQQQQQMQMQPTYQPQQYQQYQQYQQPYQQHQQQSQQQYQSPHQPYQNVQGQLAPQYPQFPPAGSYYGGQLFNSVASVPQTGQQGFAQGMMPPR